MKVDLVKGEFYCFGCGASGNAMKFVELVNKQLDKLEAGLKYYRILRSKKVRRLNIEIRSRERKDDKQALAEAEDYYFGLKTIDWNTIECSEKEYMRKRGFSPKALNICNAKLTYTSSSYPLIFPMFDLGIFRGWVCRTTSKKIEAKRKYLYNKGFSRANTLVGSYDAKVVVLVEGYMDWLKVNQNGLHKVAAILGWKITSQQIQKLRKQGVEYIISALDNDACGEKGTEYLKQFFKVIRFQFPKGIKDPGDMDRNTFRTAYEKTKQVYRKVAKRDGFSR